MVIRNKIIPKRFTLAYFSGTGCTKAVCDTFEEQLKRLELDCTKIDIASCKPQEVRKSDLLIIFAPVYALRLASLMEEWIQKLPKVNHAAAAIISVSGGGEVSPNTACRVYSKRILIKKGYKLIYEDMIVMPSNFAIQAEPILNYQLLAVLPKKVERIIADLLTGVIKLSEPKAIDRFLSSLGRAEHIGAKFFGSSLHASAKCNQCGLCVRNCPTKNIRMVNGKPEFGFHCMWCLKCIYACPRKAISPRLLKFTILKNGFDLEKMKKRAAKKPNIFTRSTKQSLLWKGVTEYIHKD
jgi:ferredoxin/flavodoxin